MNFPDRFFLIFIFFTLQVNSQSDLLSEIDYEENLDIIATFKGLKIVNFESTKILSAKQFAFSVSHRFGSVKYGFNNFFGLDDAITRLNFIYGINDYSNLSISRTTFKKTYDLGYKSKLISQSESYPITVVFYFSATLDSSLEKENYPNLKFSNRIGYFNQLMISRKFNDKFSVLVSPVFFHENLVTFADQQNSQFGAVVGARFMLTKRASINFDYGYHLNRSQTSFFKNPLGIGIDIETGGHVFQLLFSNSQSMNAINLMTSSSGDWKEGDVFFGFNLYRTF